MLFRSPRWTPEIERYDVNGIPQLEFFDRRGQAVGRSLGSRSFTELDSIATALIDDQPLPRLAGAILAKVDGQRSWGEIMAQVVAGGASAEQAARDRVALSDAMERMNRLLLAAPSGG